MLKVFWNRLQKALFFIGDLISGIFLFIFYYTVFAVFALPFKLFSRPLAVKSKNSNWRIKKSNPVSLTDFKNE